MTRYDHFIRIMVMISLIIAGLIVTAFQSGFILLLCGFSLDDLKEMQQSGMAEIGPGLTRLLLLVQHVFTFILPAFLFGVIAYRSQWMKGLRLSVSPGLLLSILGIFFLLAAYPLVNLSFMANSTIPMPDWALELEKDAEETMRAILKMDTPLIFLANLIIIAVLPGIGEELIFRGILQKQLGGIFNNKIVAIWVAAFIFSAIHFQFEGFFPRMVLGVVLGYLYYWTGNLWVSMIAHAFNNGIQIILIYTTDLDLSQVDETSSEQLQWWMIPLSVGIMYLLYNAILKNKKMIEDV